MRSIGNWQHLESAYHKGMTVMKLALSVGKITGGATGIETKMPLECYFDDNLFFEVHDDNDPDEDDIQQDQTVVIKDNIGQMHSYRRYSITNAAYQPSNNASSTSINM